MTCAHFLLWEHQNCNQLLNNHWQLKDTPHPKKKKPQWDSRRGAIRIKWNPILVQKMTQNLEKNNTEEVLPLLWRFWIPRQASQPGDLTKGLGIPRESSPEGHQDLITGLPQDWGKQGLQPWRAQSKSCTHQEPEERSSDSKETEPKLPASVGGCPIEAGSTAAPHRDGRTGGSSPGRYPLAFLEVTINPTIEPIDHRAGSPQAKQLPGRECSPVHQQIIGLKLYWAMSCPQSKT